MINVIMIKTLSYGMQFACSKNAVVRYFVSIGM